MIYCTRCGHPAGGETAFCISCGAPLAADEEQDWAPVWMEPPAESGPGHGTLAGLEPGAAPEPGPGAGLRSGPGPELSTGNVRLLGGAARAAGETTVLGGMVPVTDRGAPGGDGVPVGTGYAGGAADTGYADGAGDTGYAGGPGDQDGPGDDTAAWLPGFTPQAPALALRQPVRPARVDPPPPRRPLILPAPTEEDAYDPPEPLSGQPPSVPGGRTRAWLTIPVVLVVIAAALAAWYFRSRPHAVPAASARPARSAARRPGGPASRSGQPSPGQPSPGRSRPAAPRGSRPVALSPGVAGLSMATPVAAFLTQYFAAINDQDYPAFSSLFEPGASQIQSAAAFRSGYRTSRDSGARLVSLSQTAGGEWAASLAFDSHQDPGHSATHTACTAWAVTFYLMPVGNSYLIGAPPPGYQASALPCH